MCNHCDDGLDPQVEAIITKIEAMTTTELLEKYGTDDTAEAIDLEIELQASSDEPEDRDLTDLDDDEV